MTFDINRWAVVVIGVAAGLAFVANAAETPTPAASPKTGASSPAPAPVGAEPQSTTATFGDWVLRCERPAGGQRACEVGQILEVKGQGVVAELAIGHAAGKEGLRLTLLLPPNVTLTTEARIAASEKDESPVELIWKRCLPGGCVAEADMKEEWLKAWRAQGSAGQIRYAAASGQALAVAFSFRGLGAALDNLAKTGVAQ